MESYKVITKIDFEIQSNIKEHHSTYQHHEYELLQRKRNNYKKEIFKRRNEKQKNFKEK